MPLYVLTSAPDAVPEAAKPMIAEDVTRIHCDLTGAPRTFVHVFFHEVDDALAVHLQGNVRHGRTEETKAEMRSQMHDAIAERAGLAKDRITVATNDVPASWVMEGGDILPEPGEEDA